jgi:hypothetical protein
MAAASITAAMRFSAARGLNFCLLLAVLLLGGCGGSDDPGATAGRDGGRYKATPIDREEFERFAGMDLPDELSDLQAARQPGPLDDSVTARFAIPRENVDKLRSILSEPLEEGYRAIPDTPGLNLQTGKIKRLLGASDVVGGVGRSVVVDVDDPDRAVVYVLAGTVG